MACIHIEIFPFKKIYALYLDTISTIDIGYRDEVIPETSTARISRSAEESTSIRAQRRAKNIKVLVLVSFILFSK